MTVKSAAVDEQQAAIHGPEAPFRTPGLALTTQRRACLGVDVGPRWIRIVQGSPGGAGMRLDNYFPVLNPAGPVATGSRGDHRAVGETIDEALRRRNIRRRHAVTALHAGEAIMRTVTLPTMSREELAGVIEWEAESYLPLPADESVTDFHRLPPPEQEDQEEMKVLLVQAERKVVESYLTVLRHARLRPLALGVDMLAAYHLVAPRGGGGDGPPAALLDVGAEESRLTLFEAGAPVLSRTVSGGTGVKEAAQGGGGPPFSAAFADELARSLEYYLVQQRRRQMAGVHVMGSGSAVPGIVSWLRQGLEERLGDRLKFAGDPGIQPIAPGSHVEAAGWVPSMEHFGSPFSVALALAARGLEE